MRLSLPHNSFKEMEGNLHLIMLLAHTISLEETQWVSFHHLSLLLINQSKVHQDFNHIMTIEEIKEEVLWVRAHFNQDIWPKLGSLTIKTF